MYPEEVIKLGYNNQAVLSKVKTRLNELGYGPLTPSIGNFGLVTREAVIKFQKANHLIPDGEIGELTWARLFTPAVLERSGTIVLRLKAIEIAKTHLFVREATDHNDGPEVAKILSSVGLGVGYPWCAAFVYYCFLLASRALKVANPLPRTGGVLECYRQAKGFVVPAGAPPAPGDQFIMDFGGGKGHTGLVESVYDSRIFTVEGNTSSDPSYAGVDRDGNGVFERNRQRSTIKAYIRYQ